MNRPRMDRAERRRQQKDALDKRYGLRRTVNAYVIGDPASEKRLREIRVDHEARLKNPAISSYERQELLESLRVVAAAELVIAAVTAPEPEAMH